MVDAATSAVAALTPGDTQVTPCDPRGPQIRLGDTNEGEVNKETQRGGVMDCHRLNTTDSTDGHKTNPIHIKHPLVNTNSSLSVSLHPAQMPIKAQNKSNIRQTNLVETAAL